MNTDQEKVQDLIIEIRTWLDAHINKEYAHNPEFREAWDEEVELLKESLKILEKI